jgi:hypothetical protein
MTPDAAFAAALGPLANAPGPGLPERPGAAIF